jgi:hypothetical protein
MLFPSLQRIAGMQSIILAHTPREPDAEAAALRLEAVELRECAVAAREKAIAAREKALAARAFVSGLRTFEEGDIAKFPAAFALMQAAADGGDIDAKVRMGEMLCVTCSHCCKL